MGNTFETSLLGKTVVSADGDRGEVVSVYLHASVWLVVQLKDGRLVEAMAAGCRVVEPEKESATASAARPCDTSKTWRIRSFEAVHSGSEIEMRAYVENSNGDTRELEETLECPCDDDRMRYEDYFKTEMNSVTDNPNIFADEDKIISGGNLRYSDRSRHGVGPMV